MNVQTLLKLFEQSLGWASGSVCEKMNDSISRYERQIRDRDSVIRSSLLLKVLSQNSAARLTDEMKGFLDSFGGCHNFKRSDWLTVTIVDLFSNIQIFF